MSITITTAPLGILPLPDAFQIPAGTICSNCKKRLATENWVGEGGTLAITRGMYQRWCKRCCLREQIKHCTRAARQLPRLRRQLARLK